MFVMYYKPSNDIEADVGGDDWTRIKSNIKKEEKTLIPIFLDVIWLW